MTELCTPHGPLPLPCFLPDATRGVVRTVDAADLRAVGVPGVVASTFHLMQAPGVGAVRAAGGIHRFMGWDGPVVTDSGGFQILSLVRGRPGMGSVGRDGVVFRARPGGRRRLLSPERSVRAQWLLGADIAFCLDDCTRPEDPPEVQRAAAERTVAWARRCRREFDRLRAQGEGDGGPAPGRRLFAVVQGGTDPALRRWCAEELTALGFDGYGLGGWPVAAEGGLLAETLQLTAELMPAHLPKFALGVGRPENIVACARMGYTIFDCTLPTRDARHRRLYVFCDAEPASVLRPDFYFFHYVLDEAYVRDGRPVSEHCACPCCRRYSRAYLRHLFAVGDPLGLRLATLHNLAFYSDLMQRLRTCLWPVEAAGGGPV